MGEILLPLKRHRKNPVNGGVALWTKCLPFVENSRAILIHRPRSIVTHNIHRYPHLAVGYWCGNSTTGNNNFTFLSTPPRGKLVCEKCERAAVAEGLPSTDTLAGAHVHLGIVVPQQVCCQHERAPTRQPDGEAGK